MWKANEESPFVSSAYESTASTLLYSTTPGLPGAIFSSFISMRTQNQLVIHKAIQYQYQYFPFLHAFFFMTILVPLFPPGRGMIKRVKHLTSKTSGPENQLQEVYVYI